MVVIDYKTGEKQDRDKKQINNYANALQKMGYEVIRTEIIYTKNLLKE